MAQRIGREGRQILCEGVVLSRRGCVFSELEALRGELAGGRPSALESLLVDQVVACHAAASAAQALAASPETLGQGTFGVRQLESASGDCWRR